jgi:hypothetical protein
LPFRTLEGYWKIIERLEAAKSSTQQSDIVRETGVSGLPICAASPAFSHPFFFPLDPFHLFYENCMPHLWDTWITFSSESEIVHMSQDMASKLGSEAESAIATLPSSFCGPIRDPFKKRQSQYKIYEWMALLHWYIVPIAWELGQELGFNLAVVENFALFSNVVEYAMTTVPRTEENLAMLYHKIVAFLQGFESLYVGNEESKISRCRLCIFQLIHVPHHITYNGSVRFGSQATCERAIGEIGHGIRSKKSPFKNIVTFKTDKQSLRLLHFIYPTISSAAEESVPRVPRTSLFKGFPITQKQRREDDNLKAHIMAIQTYFGAEADPSLQVMRWGKCPLSNNVTLTSELFELSKKSTSRASRYFEAQGQQPRDQPIGDTEVGVEMIKPIFGEALAFYTSQYAGADYSLVVYRPLIRRHNLYGRWYGEWSSSVYVLETSAIVSLVGIWTYGNHVHILRRHPGLALLKSEECGISSEDQDPLIYEE